MSIINWELWHKFGKKRKIETEYRYSKDVHELPGWLLNWTAHVARNTQVEFDGLTYNDGPEWFQKMWEQWLKNSDEGRKILGL